MNRFRLWLKIATNGTSSSTASKAPFVDATRECLVRLEKHIKGEQEMYRAVLEYAKTAKTPDARVAVQRALDGKFDSADAVRSWIQVWDPG